MGEGKKNGGLRSGHNRQAERRRQEKAVAVDCGPRLDKPLREVLQEATSSIP